MIIRSICIWIAVFILWLFLINPTSSRQQAHEQRLAELDKKIARTQIEYKRRRNYKATLLKRRDELTDRLEREIKLGEEAKLLLKMGSKIVW